MASAVQVSYRDFLTLTDDQLVDLVRKYQQAQGYIDIPVRDLDKVSDQDMESIRTRLLNAQQLMKARAPPLDLNRVNELLIMDNAGGVARLPSLARDSALTDDKSHAENEADDMVGNALASERKSDAELVADHIVGNALASEKKSYAELVADGGRPLYPIEKLESVAKDPEQHRHILQPYWRYPGIKYGTDYHPDWEVFQRQLRQHKAFRNWQLDNRGIIEEPDFNAYVEREMVHLRKHLQGRGLAEIEANPESLRGPNTHWEWLQSKRARERRQYREQGCSSFAEYHAALQRRLAAHGLSEKTTLLADPRKQDALTEWHEYLGFECWWQDQYTREYKGRLKRYDQNWNFIQRQECVTSDLTVGFIENYMSIEIAEQRREARQEITKAKSKVEEARQHIGFEPVDGSHKGVTPRALGDALQQLAEAEKRCKKLDRFYEAIVHIRVLAYRCSCAKNHVDSQPALIQWVVDQIPLIKAEMEVKAHGSAISGSRKKRTREDGEDASVLPMPKLRKLAKPEETAESETTVTLVPEDTVEPEQTATLVPSSSRDDIRPRKLAKPEEMAESETAESETAESETTVTLVPESVSRHGLRRRDKSDTDQVSPVAQSRRSAPLSAKHNRTVAPTVPERKTRVNKPARSATTRKERKPSTKVDTDTGKRSKRG
ncbi:hypothetical protein ARSEF4850_004504 [Beauveria asiatica]